MSSLKKDKIIFCSYNKNQEQICEVAIVLDEEYCILKNSKIYKYTYDTQENWFRTYDEFNYFETQIFYAKYVV